MCKASSKNQKAVQHVAEGTMKAGLMLHGVTFCGIGIDTMLMSVCCKGYSVRAILVCDKMACSTLRKRQGRNHQTCIATQPYKGCAPQAESTISTRLHLRATSLSSLIRNCGLAAQEAPTISKLETASGRPDHRPDRSSIWARFRGAARDRVAKPVGFSTTQQAALELLLGSCEGFAGRSIEICFGRICSSITAT